jgi:hypothetical protein
MQSLSERSMDFLVSTSTAKASRGRAVRGLASAARERHACPGAGPPPKGVPVFRLNRIAVSAALATMLAVPALVSTAGAARHDPPCSITPGSVALDQSYTLSASGLPTGGTVNMIVTYPNGTTGTGPVSVASDGTFTLTTSSANAYPPEQVGTYSYQFVGKVRWPEGTFNQSYSSCAVQVG